MKKLAKNKNYEIDMRSGPLFSKIILFALPLLATYVLQLLFNATDLVVIGQYAHYNAMAAIGATMNLNALVINVFIGLSVGTNVVAARSFGANDIDKIKSTVSTSMTIAIYGGVAVMLLALLIAKPMLELMGTPEEILPLSCKYLWIYFFAIPFIMFYNFGCAILRALGDTRRPLIILIIAGVVNVLLNMFFVIVCSMDVGGVAFATAISHVVAASLIYLLLVNPKQRYALNLRKLAIEWNVFKEILKVGIPAGVQSSCFAISNMVVQSSINSFGAAAMAGTTAVLSLEGMLYVGSFAFHQTTISFVAQNLGGHKFKRILKCFYICLICSVVITSSFGAIFLAFGEELLSFFNPDPEVIAWGLLRMKMLFLCYGICGIMDVASGGLRGLGYSATSTVIVLLSVCLFRVWWVMFLFPKEPTMEFLVLSYPITWALAAIISCLALFYFYRRLLYSKCSINTPWLGLNPGLPRGLRYIVGSK